MVTTASNLCVAQHIQYSKYFSPPQKNIQDIEYLLALENILHNTYDNENVSATNTIQYSVQFSPKRKIHTKLKIFLQ